MFNRGTFLALTLIGSVFTSLLPITLANAQTNAITQLVPFQGRLHNSEGNVVPDGIYDLTYYIYDTATGGVFKWSENHSQVSVIHGYVNVLLGGTPSGSFSDKNVDFSTQKYLSISINGGQEMFPRHQLVPTFHAFNADKLGGIDAAGYATDVDVTAIIERVDTDVKDINTNITNILGDRFVEVDNEAGNKAKTAALADLATNAITASNSLKLNSVEAKNYARKDIHETFSNNITVSGDVHVGKDGGGDSSVSFYDDNSNEERFIFWDDSENSFQMQLNDNTYTPIGGGLVQVWSGNSATRHNSWGDGYYIVVVTYGGVNYPIPFLVYAMDTVISAPYGIDANLGYSTGNVWDATHGNVIRVFKVQTPISF